MSSCLEMLIIFKFQTFKNKKIVKLLVNYDSFSFIGKINVANPWTFLSLDNLQIIHFRQIFVTDH
jgi:hypothetical protein